MHTSVAADVSVQRVTSSYVHVPSPSASYFRQSFDGVETSAVQSNSGVSVSAQKL